MIGFTGTTNIIHPSYAGMGTTMKVGSNLIGNGYISAEELENMPEPKKNGLYTVNTENQEGIFTVNKNNGNGSNLIESLKAQQQAQWQREDSIRKETQEREDTAYQRAVADMKKAGINPNLMSVQPAASGGGIMTASQMDNAQASQYSEEMNRLLEEWKTELNNSTTIDENTKNRWAEFGERLLQGAMNIAGLVIMSKMRK